MCFVRKLRIKGQDLCMMMGIEKKKKRLKEGGVDNDVKALD